MNIILGSYTRVRDFRKQQNDYFQNLVKERQENPILKTISQEKAFMNIPAVKLSISQEGMDSWRELVKKQQEELPNPDEEKGVFIDPATVTDYSILLHEKMPARFTDSREYSAKEVAVNRVEAYGKLYDEIVRGYESGQREAYVCDPDAEDGLRRLTLEEELAYLNEAFEKGINRMVNWYEQIQKNRQIRLKDLRLEHATGAEREQLLREQEEREYRLKMDEPMITLPENTKEKLTSAVQEFISQYLSRNGGSVSQILANIKSLSEFRK